MLPEIECGRCHLKWLPRTLSGKPVRCPRCGRKYEGPVVVGVLLPYEADQFFKKTGFDYNHIFLDALKAYLETWQLSELEKGKDIDRALFQESVEVFKILGEENRSVKMEAVDEILSGKYPVPDKIYTKES